MEFSPGGRAGRACYGNGPLHPLSIDVYQRHLPRFDQRGRPSQREKNPAETAGLGGGNVTGLKRPNALVVAQRESPSGRMIVYRLHLPEESAKPAF
jgi:hypothetical protein